MNTAGYSPGPFKVCHYTGFGHWREASYYPTQEAAKAAAQEQLAKCPPGHAYIIYDSDGDPVYEVRS
jgi:hypothetical protein